MPAPHHLPFAAGVLGPQLPGPPVPLLHHLLHQLLDEASAGSSGAHILARKQQGVQEPTSAVQDLTLC